MVGLEVDESGQVFTSGKLKQPILLDGLEMFLPTDDNVRTSTRPEGNTIVTTKALFHPMDEDPYSGENKSFNKFRSMIELKMTGVIYQLGEVLFNIVANGDTGDDIEIASFVAKLNANKKTRNSKKVDANTIKQWVKIFEKVALVHKDSSLITLYSKRGGKLEGIKYSRMGVITFPLLEKLVDYNPKKEDLHGIKIGAGDVSSIVSLYEYLFGNKDELVKGIQLGSLNKIAPATQVLLTMYDHLYNSVKDIIEVISGLDVDTSITDNLTIGKLPIPLSAVGDFIDNNEQEIKRVPTDNGRVEKRNTAQQATTTTPKPATSGWGNTVKNNPPAQPNVPMQPVAPPPPPPPATPRLGHGGSPWGGQPQVNMDPWSVSSNRYAPQNGQSMYGRQMSDPWSGPPQGRTVPRW